MEAELCARLATLLPYVAAVDGGVRQQAEVSVYMVVMAAC